MNKKIYEGLQAAVKDYGLSKDAIDALAESASKGVADDASDDAIKTVVETYASIAKITQGEVTRKVQQSKQKSEDPHKGEEDGRQKHDDEPEWFKSYRKEQDEKLAAAQKEIEAYKTEKSKAERSELIKATAKELGIPEYLMKRVTFADDADIKKELAEYKQDLVNNSLLPKNSGGGRSSDVKEMQESAEAWAKSLPDAGGGSN